MAEKKNTTGIQKFKDLQKVFDENMLWADRNVLRLVAATLIGNQMDMDPIWIMLVAPPSSGKTEIISSMSDIRIGGNQTVWPISDLTKNAFMSGFKKTGKETSLLHQMPHGGILAFKDFTSLLSKNRDDQKEILGQLREIYDREYEKRIGTGDVLSWKGKVGAIAGSTEVIYEHLESVSAMGDRFIMYSIQQPNREEVLRLSLKSKRDGVNKDDSRARRKEALKEYVEYIVDNMKDEDVVFDEETEENVIKVADFCTRVRSGVVIDERKGHIRFVPSKEMPMRMAEQLLAIASALIVMDATEPLPSKTAIKGKLSAADTDLLFKIAFDSIPIKRRLALRFLAQYKGGITTAGLATKIGYQTPVVAGWLAQLNSLGVCNREKNLGPQGDKWTLRDEYRSVMVKFEGIKVSDEELKDESIAEKSDDDWLEAADTARQEIDAAAAGELDYPQD